MSKALCLLAVSALAETLMASATSTQPQLPRTTQPCPETPGSVVLLGSHEPNTAFQGADGGILIREIFRQALLIAARDGLGLATRDMTLREPLAADGHTPESVLEIDTLAAPGRFMALEIRRRRDGETELIWNKKLPLREGDISYDKLVELGEQLARRDFVDVLKTAGFGGEGNTANPDSELPPAVEEDLRKMSFLSQYAALRQIHAAMRTSGESPANLAGLVRGYANLGQLTQFHWNASHKAFKARALLYAQRMVAADPASPWALWHRAYARALAGMHGAALADIAEADRQHQATTTGLAGDQAARAPAAPTWVKLIEAYCRYDTAQLQAGPHRDPENAELALLLWFLTVENSDSSTLKVQTALAVLRACPECFRVHDAMCDVGGVSNLHRATTFGPSVLRESLPTRLPALPGIPAAVKLACKSPWFSGPADEGLPPANLPSIVKALLEAGAPGKDATEPSWAVLARLIEEVAFVQVQRRAHFVRYTWCLPLQDVQKFLNQALPLVAGHPYRSFIASYAVEAQRDPPAFSACFADLQIVDADFGMTPLIKAMWNIPAADGAYPARDAWKLAFLHVDAIARDLELNLANNNEGARPAIARRLLAVSPHSPYAVAALILWDWPYASQHAQELEQTHGQQLPVIAALARRYSSLKQLDDAQRCLKRWIALAPDKWAYTQLADSYLQQGNLQGWQATLDEYLQQPDEGGLSHAQVRVTIARHFMTRREYDKALPYADAAAETWAGWAMMCASECHELLGQWDQAELWVRRTAERYDDSRLSWYLWCKRTGRGDVQAAQRLAAEYVRPLEQQTNPDALELGGIFHILSGKPAKAIQYFQKAFSLTNNPYSGLQIAILADQLGDSETRDATLQTIAEKGHEYLYQGQPLKEHLALAKLFQQCLAKGPRAWLDLKAADDLVNQAQGADKTNLCYFIGRFLELHGHADWAEKYLQRAAVSSHTFKWNHTLARDLLRSRGVKLGDALPGGG
jgi:tetratricopeptide (TPR) repeat protein